MRSKTSLHDVPTQSPHHSHLEATQTNRGNGSIENPTMNNISSSSSGIMRSSASQSYFDRYPDRKGRGQLVPSLKLTPSQSSYIPRDNARPNQQLEYGEGPRRREDTRSGNQVDVGEFATEDRLSNLSHCDADRCRTAHNDKDAMLHITSLPSASSSLMPDTTDIQSNYSRKSNIVTNSTSPSHDLNHSSASEAITRRAAQLNVSTQEQNVVDLSTESRRSLMHENWIETAKISAPTTPVPRKLKEQQSMPNFRGSMANNAVSSGFYESWTQPWPTTAADSSTGSAGRRRHLGSGMSPSPAVPSINEIVRRHTPTTPIYDAQLYGAIEGKRKLLKTRVSEGQRGVDCMMNADEGDSDSSLDSVGKEVRRSIQSLKPQLPGSRKVQTSNGSAGLTSSPSNSHVLLRTKKSILGSPSLLNPARALMASTSMKSSLSSPTSIQPKSRGRMSRRSTNSVDSISQSTQKVSDSASDATTPLVERRKKEEVIQFLNSKRLTTLMTLTRPPYSGCTVSFADVGDQAGHPVFVFLGLGAVRYLVGLYDEMAKVLGLRLLCIDRWGLGKTDDVPAEKRGVLEWSSVVAEVADGLNLERFSLLAHSAGAPYAMGTCLLYGPRIAGPVHLLAPWVGPTMESGYKWLRYVPDGLIKTAQAAEWKMQAWKLGVGRASPTLSNEFPRLPGQASQGFAQGDELLYASSKHTYQRDTDSRLQVPPNRTFRISRGETGSDTGTYEESVWSTATDAPSRSPSTSAEMLLGVGGDSSSTDDHMMCLPSGWTLYDESVSAESHASQFAAAASLHTLPSSSRLGSSRLESKPVPSPSAERPSMRRSFSGPAKEAGLAEMPESPSDLTTALLRASHAESLRGGGTNDLLVILGRSSQKPWGFSYTHIMHDVFVWHGDKDERISMSSILWMEREMKSCKVNLVEGASHGLMTNVAVVVEALESIATTRGL